jgi:hypothetical protein
MIHFSTSMTQSGHITAQNAHPVHLSVSTTPAGWNPFEFSLSFLMITIFFGHAETQSPQPLHLSSENVVFAIFRSCIQDIGNIIKFRLIKIKSIGFKAFSYIWSSEKERTRMSEGFWQGRR